MESTRSSSCRSSDPGPNREVALVRIGAWFRALVAMSSEQGLLFSDPHVFQQQGRAQQCEQMALSLDRDVKKSVSDVFHRPVARILAIRCSLQGGLLLSATPFVGDARSQAPLLL